MPPKRKRKLDEPVAKGAGGDTKSTAKQKKLSDFFAESEKTTETKDVGSSTKLLSALLTEQGWKKALSDELKSTYFSDIQSFLDTQEKASKQVFPPRNLVFNAFNSTPFDAVKVVILGQDPYHDDRQAHGLSFSVQKGVNPPPSLKNIFQELKNDLKDFTIPSHGDLSPWSQRGVLLLNATLTVEAHKANSHSSIGWQRFTDAAIRALSDGRDGLVFVLWGGFAHKKERLIAADKHTIIKTAHPSPLSVTKFRGCRCFSGVNEALQKYGKLPIDWSL